MICVIGAANMDIQGFSKDKIIFYDSNPGILKKGYGGVARNICENLSMLNTNTSFIAPIGDDIFSNNLIKYMEEKNIDMSKCLICKDKELSSYLAILNEEHEMILAISSMEILEFLNVDYLKNIEDFIKSSKVVVLDTNLNQDVLEYISKTHNRVVLDLVSTKKAMKVKDFIGNFHTIKANKIEAQKLSDIPITNNQDLVTIGKYFIKKGVKNIFITLGPEGIFYMNKHTYSLIQNPKIKVADITGAGDAFTAGIAYSLRKNYSIEKMARISLCMSLINVSNYGTCYQKLNEELIQEFLAKYFKEEV